MKRVLGREGSLARQGHQWSPVKTSRRQTATHVRHGGGGQLWVLMQGADPTCCRPSTGLGWGSGCMGACQTLSRLSSADTVVLGHGARRVAIVGLLWMRETEAREPNWYSEYRASAQKQIASADGSPVLRTGLSSQVGGSVLPDFPEEGTVSPLCAEALV